MRKNPELREGRREKKPDIGYLAAARGRAGSHGGRKKRDVNDAGVKAYIAPRTRRGAASRRCASARCGTSIDARESRITIISDDFLPLLTPPPIATITHSLFLSHRSHPRFHDAQAKYIFYGHTGDYRQNRRKRDVGLPFKVYPNNSPKVIGWIFSWSEISKVRDRSRFFFFFFRKWDRVARS